MESAYKMKKRVLIVEDHPKWMEKISEIVSAVSVDVQIHTATNVKDAYLISMETNIDLFIVDIILDTQVIGDVSGMTFAENIREHMKYRYIPIIFITSLEDPKLKAYSNIHCYSYIEKPFDRQKVIEAVEEALEIPLKKQRAEYVYFRRDGILHGFCVDDIMYIEVKGHATTVYSCMETAKVAYYSIKRLLQLPELEAFIQCNRGVIVNRKFIKYVDATNRYVKLDGVEEPIEIGTVIKKEFLQELKYG